MQEELQQKTIALSFQAASLTGEVLKAVITKYLDDKAKDEVKPRRGKQTMRELLKHNAAVSNIEITDGNIKSFERVAKAYGLDFALKKDQSVEPPKYLVFFKGRDVDVINAAFREYVGNRMGGRLSIRQRLAQVQQDIGEKARELVKGRSLEQGL